MGAAHSLDDQRLVLRILNQESGAFEALVRRHQARLYSIAHRILSDRELAADAVQETFLRVHRKLGDYRPTGSFSGWLSRIVVNLCLNELQKRKRWDLPGDDLEVVSLTDSPEQDAVASDMRAVVQRETARLSPPRQAVLALAVLGYGYEEMEEILGWKLSQVKSELFRARQKLREALLRAGYQRKDTV